MAPLLRAGRDADADEFIALIGACWAEYPGCVMDVDGEVPELRALASYYAAQGGALWVAEDGGRVVGMVATAPLDDGAWEICKMYAYPAQRGSGLARALIETAEAFARAHGATAMQLWSDTRFDRAHRFYENRSYVRAGAIRALNDLSNSMEFGYAKMLAGTEVARLDAAAAVSAVPRLAAVLKACVDDGASLSFHAPLAIERARAHYRGEASRVARGEAVLFAAWCEGVLVGTVSLGLDMAENQRHRAVVANLMVEPGSRRRGIGRALLRAAETAAQAAGREVLSLETLTGGGAEPLFLGEGWLQLGVIPDFTRTADGTRQATTFFWKRV
jgi:GNAT superfamily N-acetyltransferase